MKTKKKPIETPPVRRDRDGLTRCRMCSCTEREPCNPPCGWVKGEADICDRCYIAATVYLDWQDGAHRPSNASLLREVARMRSSQLPNAWKP